MLVSSFNVNLMNLMPRMWARHLKLHCWSLSTVAPPLTARIPTIASGTDRFAQKYLKGRRLTHLGSTYFISFSLFCIKNWKFLWHKWPVSSRFKVHKSMSSAVSHKAYAKYNSSLLFNFSGRLDSRMLGRRVGSVQLSRVSSTFLPSGLLSQASNRQR